MVRITIFLTETPLATAAVSDRPVARRSKPNRVRPSSTQYAMPTAIATTTKPYTSPRGAGIRRAGQCAGRHRLGAHCWLPTSVPSRLGSSR